MKVQNSDLSDNRFGNQIFQYFFLKLLEQHLGLRATCLPWVGDQLFDLDYSAACEPAAVTVDLEPQTNRSNGYRQELEKVRDLCQQTDGVVDIRGYFQYHTWNYRRDKALFLNAFPFRQLIRQQVQQSLQRIGLEDAFTIGVHMRAGDYRQFTAFHPLFWMPSMDAYLQAIRQLRDSHIRNYAIYLATDEVDTFRPQLAAEGLSVVTGANLFGELSPTLAMLVDYYMLAHSDALVISNSSFSFSAAMLNQRARVYMRPGTRNEAFIPFDPWNSQVLIPRSFT